jgi:hypothetical protein
MIRKNAVRNCLVKGGEKHKKRYIHVNQHVLKSNKKHGKCDPVLTIKTGRSGKVVRAHQVAIIDAEG